MKVLAVCAAALLCGCSVEKSDPVRETRSVPAGGAESARITLDLGAGELRVQPGAADLIDAEFSYDPPSLKPDVRYDVAAGRGYLTVRQPSIGKSGLRTVRDSNWSIRLNERMPTELKVNMGAGKGVLKLAKTSVTRLEVEIGAGEIELDLDGTWEKDLEGRVRGGVGQATVRLPRTVGVRVRAHGGIGGISVDGLKRSGEYWVNDAYGKSPVDIRLEVTGGIGEIRLIG